MCRIVDMVKIFVKTWSGTFTNSICVPDFIRIDKTHPLLPYHHHYLVSEFILPATIGTTAVIL